MYVEQRRHTNNIISITSEVIMMNDKKMSIELQDLRRKI
ncbi:hypothetical protein OTSKARP_1250 [Orientia tsutsugamushi str. Karp]|nr:hypothetical protein OTSKARP_1250 [Orientia tsutsugamushi str. Karp]